ncbi:Uncharacterised protein [Vibrio cholerae]|nr:Uncharacterised protein [Vibrio cholerae]
MVAKIPKRNFRGIGCEAKHGFATKQLANGNAIKPTHQLFALPHLNRMATTLFRQLAIRMAH